MTEAEWLACNDPQAMLRYSWGKANERKIRLFEVASCRRILKLLPDERSRKAVEVAERHADARATDEELETAADAACAVWDADIKRASMVRQGDSKSLAPAYTASAAAYNVATPPGWWGGAPAFVAPHEIVLEATADSSVERAAQCSLLRDIFGNPFRHVSINPAWRTPSVVKMAEFIYDQRVFDRMLELADILVQAGCTNTDVLAHCREPGEHVRGCWVVDLLLDFAGTRA